jgi:hypothetical protein
MIVVVFAMCKKKDGYANSEYEHMTVTPKIYVVLIFTLL